MIIISYHLKLKNRKINLTEYYDLVYEYKNDCLKAGIKYKNILSRSRSKAWRRFNVYTYIIPINYIWTKGWYKLEKWDLKDLYFLFLFLNLQKCLFIRK